VLLLTHRKVRHECERRETKESAVRCRRARKKVPQSGALVKTQATLKRRKVEGERVRPCLKKGEVWNWKKRRKSVAPICKHHAEFSREKGDYETEKNPCGTKVSREVRKYVAANEDKSHTAKDLREKEMHIQKSAASASGCPNRKAKMFLREKTNKRKRTRSPEKKGSKKDGRGGKKNEPAP